jgi:hypothetical protein
MRLRRLLPFLFLLLAAPAAAQIPGIVVNPTTCTFTASPDHAATSPLDGTPLLTGYRMYYFLFTDTNLDPANAKFTIELGKPAPDGSNVITVVDPTTLFSPVVKNTAYKAIIFAYGPGGVSPASNTSNPFGVPGAPRGVPGTVSIAR